MSTLQWALLLLGAAIAVALVASSLREKWAKRRPPAPPQPRMTGRDWEAGAGPQTVTLKNPAPPPPPAPAPAPAAPRAPMPAVGEVRESFDEFGVGKPRRRVAPEVSPAAGVAEPPAVAPAKTAPTVTPTVASAPPQLFGLYIAEHEGTMILGPKIHSALAQRGLRFGHKKIYHRYEGDAVQFSVASLTKPGSLDPAESEGFATPGLSVFMVLPGPARPLEALAAMLDTARALAKSLNAELYDSEQRAPLTAEREQALKAQVEDWARRAGARGGA